MCVIVGKCGALWGAVLWIGGGVGEKGIISDCGMGANVGVCGLRGVQIFTNFDIFKKILILTFFHHHLVLRNINYLSKYHKNPSFPLHPANFPYVDM